MQYIFAKDVPFPRFYPVNTLQVEKIPVDLPGINLLLARKKQTIPLLVNDRPPVNQK